MILSRIGNSLNSPVIRIVAALLRN
jgi:hypothetical protein